VDATGVAKTNPAHGDAQLLGGPDVVEGVSVGKVGWEELRVTGEDSVDVSSESDRVLENGVVLGFILNPKADNLREGRFHGMHPELEECGNSSTHRSLV